MTVVKTRTFRSGKSKALRLPKDIAFGPDVELPMVRSGDVLTVYPTRPSIQATHRDQCPTQVHFPPSSVQPAWPFTTTLPRLNSETPKSGSAASAGTR